VLWDARSHQHVRTLQMQGRITAMIVMCDAADAAADHDDGHSEGMGASSVILALDDGEGGCAVDVLQQIAGIDGNGRTWGLKESSVVRPLASGGGGSSSNVYITCMARGPSCIGCGCR
jgi:hypothetical protein